MNLHYIRIAGVCCLILLGATISSTSQVKRAISRAVNTKKFSEFSPTVSADGKTLFFESDRDGTWKLYFSDKVDGKWQEPKEVKPVNNGVSDANFLGGPFLTYDGETLYITTNRHHGRGGMDIWKSERKEDGSWGQIENIGRPVNSRGYDGFCSVSADGEYIYFMRCSGKRGPGGQHCCDIYRAERKGERYWHRPEKLPSPVNTGCEAFPRIMADNQTLIFSSIRGKEKGGFDLYQSTLQKDGTWSDPVPLDYVNTEGDDEIIAVPASGDVMYFSSTRDASEDIFKISIPDNLRPKNIVEVKGKVQQEKTGKAVPAEITVKEVPSGEKVAVYENKPPEGNYSIILREGEEYDISVTSKGHYFYSDRINLKNLDQYKVKTKDITLEKLEPDKTFRLDNIYFAFDKATLSDSSRYELQRLVRLMEQNKAIKVEIAAHTDDKGSDEYNEKLSQRRAQSVVDYLVNHGVSRKRLEAKGYGASQPVVPNTSKENRAKNRRVAFKVIERQKK